MDFKDVVLGLPSRDLTPQLFWQSKSEISCFLASDFEMRRAWLLAFLLPKFCTMYFEKEKV